MRELVIVAKCDRCDAHVDSDVEPVTHTIDNRTVETDLCEKCGAEWETALNDFFRGARPVAKTRGKKPRSKPKATTGESIPCKHKTCKRTFDTPQGASLHYRRTHGG
jgi:hypothetical protein